MPEPKFRHTDDEKWEEVRSIQIGDRRASVWEKWLEFTPNFLCLYAKWDPGMMIHKHGHNSDHVLFVIEGEVSCGDVRCTPGMHITLEQGAAWSSLFVHHLESGQDLLLRFLDLRSLGASTRDQRRSELIGLGETIAGLVN